MRPTPSPPRPHPSCRQTRSSIDGDPSFSIHLSLCSTDFHQLPRSYEEIRLLHAHRHSRRCLLPAYRSRGPMQISQGKDTECTAAPGLNTAPISVGFRALRSLARSPDRPGLSKASLAFGAAACLRLLPHTASRRQGLGVSRRRSLHAVAFSSARGCYQLAPQRTFTSNPVPMPGIRGFPCCVDLPAHACHRQYPGGTAECLSRSLPQRRQPSPLERPGRLPHPPFRGLLDVHCTLQPACSPSHHSDPLHQRLQPFRYLHDCSDCYRPERKLPGGSISHWKIAPLHGARRRWVRRSNLTRRHVLAIT